MERREGWLGYIAVGLGALSLLVALLGSSSPTRVEITLPEAGFTQMPDVMPIPAMPQAPADVMPALPPLPQLDGIPEAQRQRFQAWREEMRAWQHQRGDLQFAQPVPFSMDRHEFWMNDKDNWHRGWGPGAGGPTVFKVIVAVFAIGVGLRLVRGRKGGPGHTPAPPTPTSMA